MWLDKLSDKIYISNLYKKYDYKETRFDINPVIGEYDNPSLQTQGLLTLPITNGGNTVVYGTSESGKDELLESIVYSIITHHDTSEVNLYLIDYGAETLMNFMDAPQVGDVILGNDDEKLKNLIKLLNKELNERKKLFTRYGGNYKDYLKLSGKTLPNIVVIINSVEVMNELYMDMIDNFVPFIREGAKYGITFIITTENNNTIKMKVTQSCKQVMTLQMNNDTAYKDILGKTDGIVPSPSLGRGLIKLDKVVEFQTAFICDADNIVENINKVIDALKEKGLEKASSVPIMKDIITLADFKSTISLESIPVGIAKDSLVPITFDLKKAGVNIISSNEIGNTTSYVKNLINSIQKYAGADKIVMDAISYFDGFDFDIKYVNENFDNVINELFELNSKLVEKLNQNNMNIKALKDDKDTLCFILGFDKLYSKFTQETKDKFHTLLQNSSDIAKICFILVDVPAGFKKYEFEAWYKSAVNPNYGIWIGSGFTQQFVLKSLMSQNAMSNIESDYGVIVRNGVPLVVKLLNEVK